jgi:GxxExxY protein
MNMSENELSKIVFECGLKVHKALGPGLLESAYEECLYYELIKHNIYIEKQKGLPLMYEEVKLDIGFRADFILEKKLIIEIKAVDAIHDIHLAQIITYLKLSGCKVGLLLNFKTSSLKYGIKRIVI